MLGYNKRDLVNVGKLNYGVNEMIGDFVYLLIGMVG